MNSETSFIEKQFPVSKVSKESYKERKANNGQTLTGLGKWWGRKPLVLVRATVLGCLMPCSDNPKADMDIFLKIMSMDNDGLLERKVKSIPAKELYEAVGKSKHLKQFREEWFKVEGSTITIKNKATKNDIETKIFKTLGYDAKLKCCKRPEQLSNIKPKSWEAINKHLGTSATCLTELIDQLSLKKFGHRVRVGDCFAGGGSIPFEAARMGADVYASDLNPIAGLLNWANLNILGASAEVIQEVEAFRQKIYDEVDQEIIELGIEHNEKGDRAIYYLYC